jgi:O-antigen/teichoic acid export membrane protein
MEKDGFLTLDGIAEVRSATERTLMRTVLFHSAVGFFAGAGFAALAYFANWKQTGDPTLTTVFGICGLVLAVPRIVCWVRHFRSMLQQLSAYESRVREGEHIPSSSVRFHRRQETRTQEPQQS